VRLSQEEGRVIGSLIEKQLTTPQQYPLSLNALLLACNQSSNRDPVVEYDETTIDNTLASLKTAGLISYVYPSHGRSVTRYQQLVGEQLALTQQQLALVAVLLLRGPQTGGELRSRTERMCEFDSIAQVDAELERLSALPEPVVARLSRRPGQKEERWAQLLMDSSTDVLVQARADAEERGTTADRVVEMVDVGEVRSEVGELRSEVGELRSEVAELRSEVAELRSEVGELTVRVTELHDEFETLRRELYG
jgi:uncharacterized protein